MITAEQLEQHAAAIAILALAVLVATLLTYEAIAQVVRGRADRRRQQAEQLERAASWHDTIEIPRPRRAAR